MLKSAKVVKFQFLEIGKQHLVLKWYPVSQVPNRNFISAQDLGGWLKALDEYKGNTFEGLQIMQYKKAKGN